MTLKVPDIVTLWYLWYRRCTGKQQRFTIRSGVLTSICSRQRSAISGRPLPKWTAERTDFRPALCSLTLYSLHPAKFSGNDSLRIDTHLPTLEGWKMEGW